MNAISTDEVLVVDRPQSDYARLQPHSRLLTEVAAKVFSRCRVLYGVDATKAAILAELQSWSVLQFSGYGYDNRGEPLESGLIAANDEVITMRDLFDLDLRGLRLVVLSGLDGSLSRHVRDEGRGIAFDLVLAGAHGVVAPMWLVTDLSAMLLLIRFYELWCITGISAATALTEAQRWLRRLTAAEAAQHLGANGSEYKDAFEALFLAEPSSRPFSHPFYWAGFRFIGA